MSTLTGPFWAPLQALTRRVAILLLLGVCSSSTIRSAPALLHITRACRRCKLLRPANARTITDSRCGKQHSAGVAARVPAGVKPRMVQAHANRGWSAAAHGCVMKIQLPPGRSAGNRACFTAARPRRWRPRAPHPRPPRPAARRCAAARRPLLLPQRRRPAPRRRRQAAASCGQSAT